MNFATGEIILVPIPFTDLSSQKVRPAVIIGLASHVGDLFVTPISSKLQNTDLTLRDWKLSGLNVVCGIKSQMSTVESQIVLKTVGKLSMRDKASLDSLLRRWLGL